MKNIIEPVTTPPASDELKLRLDTIRAMMVDKELDYYVAGHTDNEVGRLMGAIDEIGVLDNTHQFGLHYAWGGEAQ